MKPTMNLTSQSTSPWRDDYITAFYDWLYLGILKTNHSVWWLYLGILKINQSVLCIMTIFAVQ